MSYLFPCQSMPCDQAETCQGVECGGYTPEPSVYCCMCGDTHKASVDCNYTEEELERHEAGMVRARAAKVAHK